MAGKKAAAKKSSAKTKKKVARKVTKAKKAKKVSKVKKARPPAKIKKTAAKKASPKGPLSAAPKAQVPKGQLIGSVTHFFPHVNAAAVMIDKGAIRLGDRLYFKGHTTDFEQGVSSLQIDHNPVEKAGVGDEVGIGVRDRVRQGDNVYKLQ